ncbi:hypothetical protein CTEN210_02207 [Chaetoceros tenuissimus]|uniref:Fe2OG dioxygenase domain-containing protein n=1 Tax=Chaetoceros tenuissimus TaxID=426638 RepID=A0AAD3CHI2_9STRA|nr:hypothetical protein CTEN210_02207 [Chaetoceros tenuissimus]
MKQLIVLFAYAISQGNAFQSSDNTRLSPIQAVHARYPLKAQEVDVTQETEYFWKEVRSRDEILLHVTKSIFPNHEFAEVSQNVKVISNELPLITIDNFISENECIEIMRAAEELGTLKRSTLGASQEVSNLRTSSTIWLTREHCENPILALQSKANILSGIPIRNYENLQVVKYNGNGEKFGLHTDHLEAFNDLKIGGRLATCLVYLNSAAEGFEENRFTGGTTHFPEYNVFVKPKVGRAVFWFNTIERIGGENFNPNQLRPDLRSRHSGTPVHNGEKWVCNLWMHPFPLS